jgi:hypothetical protein
MAAAEQAAVVDVPVGAVCRDLLRLLGGVSDGRSSQGRDHPAGVVLALAAAATVAGMNGCTAMAGWVADVPEAIVTDLYLRAGGRAGGQAQPLDDLAGVHRRRPAGPRRRDQYVAVQPGHRAP